MVLKPRVIEKQGRTIEEATQAALQEADCSAEEASIEVLEEPNQGFLGILGKRQAKVRVTVMPTKTEYLESFLKELLSLANIERVQIDVREASEAYECKLDGDDLAVFIGRHGQTLDALQYLCNLVCKPGRGSEKPVHLDVAGYRQRRWAKLEDMAERMAEKALRLNKPIYLQAMSAKDRRIIHLHLQNREDVTTESTGREPYRKVVIKPTGR